MISSISSFENTSVIHFANSERRPEPKVFFWIAAPVTDAVAINPNGTKKFLSTFFIKDQTVFSNGPRSLPRNPPNCTVLYSWDFENFILPDEPFAKVLQTLENFVLVNNNLCWKLDTILSRFLVKNLKWFILLLQ